MRRHGIFIGVALPVVVLILVAAFARFDVNQYRAQIQTEMQQRLGRKVALGNLKLALIPLRFRVENLSISEAPGFGGDLPFLKADTAHLSVRLMPLLGKKIEVSAISIITGTFEHPKFAPDMQQLAMMQLKGIVPTSDNPFGVLGHLMGPPDQNENKAPAQNPVQGIDKVLGKFLGGKK